MPVQRGLTPTTAANARDLQDRLAQEMTTATQDGPLVIYEPDEPAPITRIFVIWDDWGSLSQQERSAIVLKAYETAHGTQETLRIVVAMGITKKEAQAMGIAVG